MVWCITSDKPLPEIINEGNSTANDKVTALYNQFQNWKKKEKKRKRKENMRLLPHHPEAIVLTYLGRVAHVWVSNLEYHRFR